MANVIRDAVDSYLAADLDDAERADILADTFGCVPGLAARVPSRDDWDRATG